MQHTPLCYSSASSRFSMLRGKWTRNQSHRPTYSNLSCALEWSKYCDKRWYGTEDPKKHRISGRLKAVLAKGVLAEGS